MPIPDPPTYKVREIESKARAFLIEHAGVRPEIPIDIELLLERLPGVHLDLKRGLEDRHSVHGMVLRDVETGELFVFIDEELADRSPTRYRMTVAEELGHIVLHRQTIDQIRDEDDFRELQQHACWHGMERNAKRCAAALLMPASMVLRHAQRIYPKLVGVAGFDNPQAIKNHLATLLAKTFDVSYQAMTYRLGEWPTLVRDKVESSMSNRLDFLE